MRGCRGVGLGWVGGVTRALSAGVEWSLLAQKCMYRWRVVEVLPAPWRTLYYGCKAADVCLFVCAIAVACVCVCVCVCFCVSVLVHVCMHMCGHFTWCSVVGFSFLSPLSLLVLCTCTMHD